MAKKRELGDGRYVLGPDPIASGGMGTVWRGHDRKLKRVVAVKELRFPEGLSEAEQAHQRARVMTEARAAALLDHPHIVPVYDIVEEDGRPWIVMRLVPGRSLAQEVAECGVLTPQRAAQVGAQILEALAAAHAQGILHRDVKPQNVLLDNSGKAVLTDFGIALISGSTTATRPITEAGMVVGTIGYLAPERLSGATPGPESDLWSLGATLYFAVEGRQAYDTGDVVTTIAAVLTCAPQPMKSAGSLAPVVMGLLARDTRSRLTAPVALEHLEAVAEGRPVQLHPTTKLLPESERLTTKLPRLSAPNGAEAGDLSGRHLPPSSSSDRRRPGRARIWWAAAVAAVVVFAAGGVAALTLLDDEVRHDDGAGRKSAGETGPAAYFASAPKVCGASLLDKARVQEFFTLSPKLTAHGETRAVVRCQWERDRGRNASDEELRVRAIAHGSVEGAKALMKENSDAMGWSDTRTTRPKIGDQAEIVDTRLDGVAQARARIGNLTLDLWSNAVINHADELETLLRDMVAEAEAEAARPTSLG